MREGDCVAGSIISFQCKETTLRHALHRLTIGMTLLLSFAVLPHHADADPAEGLIGYWPFDGSGDDLSGLSLNLTLEGGAGFAPGLFGQALSLQNTAVFGGQFAARSDDDPVYDFGSSDFTMQAWVNFTDISREEVVIEKFGGPAGPGWTLTKLIDGAWQLYVTTTGEPLIVTSDPQQNALDVWHHIVVRRSGDLFELVFDGAVVGSGKSNQPLTGSGTPLLVGRRTPLDFRNFAVGGRIDDVAIWKRALRDDEVIVLFNGGLGNPVIDCEQHQHGQHESQCGETSMSDGHRPRR